MDPTYGAGLEKGGLVGGVPNTYFPVRQGCNLILYQDAHQVYFSDFTHVTSFFLKSTSKNGGHGLEIEERNITQDSFQSEKSASSK